jgi:hypothetical protein
MTTIRLALFIIAAGVLVLLLNALRSVFVYGDVGVALFITIGALALLAFGGAAAFLMARPDPDDEDDFADEEPTTPYAAHNIVVVTGDQIDMAPRGRALHTVRRSALLSLVLAAFVVAGVGCSNGCAGAPKPTEVVKHTVIDCLAENQEQLAAVAGQMILQIPNWDAVKQTAIQQGMNLGGCAIAKVVNAYLAPAGGRSAPELDDGGRARAALETVRARAGEHVIYRTELGDL